MQKKILTLAVAGALGVPGLAFAQGSGAPTANVEVYGTINLSVGNFSYGAAPVNAGNAGPVSEVSKWDVASHGSNFGVRGRESLGGGLTAWFQVENGLSIERSNDNSNMIGSRNTAVGVQGAWGNVFAGQWTTPWADLDSLWAIGTVGGWGPVTAIIGRRETTGVAPNQQCANSGQGVAASCNAVEAAGGVGHPFWRRVSNAVFYQSPVFNGLQGKLAYQTNEGRVSYGTVTASFGSKMNPSLLSVSAQWAGMGGAARIGVGYDKHQEFSAQGKADTGMTVKGGYDFGVFDLGMAYEKMTYQSPAGVASIPVPGECQLTNTAVAVAIPIGSGFVRGSWAKASDMNDPGCGTQGVTPINPAGSFVGPNGASQVNIGYEHRFSKRTTIGVGYARIDNDALGSHAWSGMPPNGGSAGLNAPATGSDITTFFVNMVHRF